MKVLSVFGTRAEAIKMAPLVKEIERTPGLEGMVCVTAQHREMLDSVLATFKIKPNYDLNVMKRNQSLTDVTQAVLSKMDGVLNSAMPDIVLVHGDTNTSLAAALSAFYNHIPVGHVEAGLRSFSKTSPFPEELNRSLVSRIADYHFAPTARNRENLIKENVSGEIFVTGDTVIDALFSMVTDNYSFKNKTVENLDISSKRTILLTAHRRENLGAPLGNICRAVKEIAEQYSDIQFIYPVHPNPAIQNTASTLLSGQERVHLIDPLCVEDVHNLLARCYMVMSDSGVLQEEAAALGKPMLILRTGTERHEDIEAGTAVIAGVQKEQIVRFAKILLDDEDKYIKMSAAVNPYGDGHTSRLICEALLQINI